MFLGGAYSKSIMTELHLDPGLATTVLFLGARSCGGGSGATNRESK
jgi:hypothetical protein